MTNKQKAAEMTAKESFTGEDRNPVRKADENKADIVSVIKSVSAESLALAIFSGLIARGESSLTKCGIKGLLERNIKPTSIHEIVLQSYLFCGFPRMLDALFDLAALVDPKRYLSSGPADSQELAYTLDESKTYERRGRELIQLIYGNRYGKLEKAITEMSPDVFRLMIMEGYGKTLSRPGLDVKSRELAVNAALIVDRRPRQLRAHLLGAKNVGVTSEILHELIGALATFTPEENITLATNLMGEVFPS